MASAFATIPTAEGGLATSRGSADFTMRLDSEDTLEVERDAGMRETLHRVSGNAALPADLPGRYHQCRHGGDLDNRRRLRPA